MKPRDRFGRWVMPAPLPGSLGDAETRTLVALIVLRDRNGYASVRDVAAERGISIQWAHRQLTRLHAAGLVDLGVAGALRPLVRPVRFGAPKRRRR